MKKLSFYMNCAASAMLAIALTACNAVQDNPTPGEDPENPANQQVTIQSGDTLATVIDQLAVTAENEIVVEIPAGVDTVFTGEINVPVGKKLTIVGDETLPAVIVPTASIVFANAITVKNVTIDATNSNSHLFTLSKEPDEDLKVESGQYVITDPILFENIHVKGLTKNFFADNGKAYTYVSWTLNNSIIEYTTQSNVAFNFASSMAINFNITNSTIYSKTAGTSNFIAMSGKRPWQTTGYEEETGKFICENNTFYNVANKKQFMNTNTLKGQRYLYEVKNNIFYNVSNKKIYGNMTNNKKQLTAENNVYYFDVEEGEKGEPFFSEPNYNGDEGVKLNPKFKNADEGNFTPTDVLFLNLSNKPGDPRWTKWVVSLF